MKIFGGDMITKVYNTLGADEDMPIDKVKEALDF